MENRSDLSVYHSSCGPLYLTLKWWIFFCNNLCTFSHVNDDRNLSQPCRQLIVICLRICLHFTYIFLHFTAFQVSQAVRSDPVRGRGRKEQQGQAEQARLEKIVARYKKTAGSGSWSEDEVETSGGECTVPDQYHREVVQQRDRQVRCFAFITAYYQQSHAKHD